jgi:hypothetical protein
MSSNNEHMRSAQDEEALFGCLLICDVGMIRDVVCCLAAQAVGSYVFCGTLLHSSVLFRNQYAKTACRTVTAQH